MDVEYQKKEVTWCLDRIGPKICLKATAINDKLQQLEITSEDFRLEFENEEAIEFLGILRNIMSARPTSVPVPEDITPHVPKHEEIIPSIPKSAQARAQVEISSIQQNEKSMEDIIPAIQEEKPKPVTTLDTSEILEVLKQSESSVGEERISFRKKFAENEALEKKLVPEVRTQQETEEPSPGISNEENVRPSEVFKEKLDTASFFREADEKSPLEQLLEENEDITEEIKPFETDMTDPSPIDEHEEALTELVEQPPFTPDDLNSSSFMSNFSSKSLEHDLKTPEPEIMEEEDSFDLDHQDLEPAQQSAFLNEDDRKKVIERERAARKKRLWELTRGF